MIGFMKSINTTSRCATLFRGERLEGTGLNGHQCPYVLEICRSPGITQEGLAQRIHVNRSSVTRQLSLLEENGFIERRSCESDKRAIRVYPTQRMLELLPVVREILAEWRSYLVEELSAEEVESLTELLGRIALRAEQYEEKMKTRIPR